jgi:hypothetical protein
MYIINVYHPDRIPKHIKNAYKGEQFSWLSMCETLGLIPSTKKKKKERYKMKNPKSNSKPGSLNEQSIFSRRNMNGQ